MKEFVNNKKKMISLLVFGIVMVVMGISYAWFNYTKTLSNSQLVAGDIYLTMGETGNTINLTNAFPETKEEARARNDNYMTFTLSGLNTSDKDIYYEIKLMYGDNQASPKKRYTDSDLVFDLVEIGQNNEETYVVDAKSFDSINDKRIWVDTIDHNTTTEITKTYKLRMWLSEDVIISDTVPNANYPATGDNAFKNYYGNVKVEVFGDFSEKEVPINGYDMLKKNADTTTEIDFAKISSDTNGKGLYLLKGTENDTNPIYYYRGEVNNNNVIFGGFCWLIVRTTDTGGIKIVYNGTTTGDGKTCEKTSSSYRIISSIGTRFNYYPRSMSSVGYMYNTTYTAEKIEGTTEIINASDSFTYGWEYIDDGSGTESLLLNGDGVTFSGSDWNDEKWSVYNNYICKNATNGTCSDLWYVTDVNDSYFKYIKSTDIFKFSQNVTYDSTTSKYTLDNNYVNLSLFDIIHDPFLLDNAHYTCLNSNGTCQTVSYVFSDLTSRSYINLSNGEKIEDAIYKMTGYGTNETKTRNANYNLNNTNSVVKVSVDNWFRTKLLDYQQYLEDTVFCNDRSFIPTGDYSLNSGGFNPNGGKIARDNTGSGTILGFNIQSRWRDYYSPSVTIVPVLTCPNKIDAFTVNDTLKGNGALTYPIGLLTTDEFILAGTAGQKNTNFYLNSADNFWIMTPYFYNSYGGIVMYFSAYDSKVTRDRTVDESTGGRGGSIGVRPVVSLKPGIEFETGGDGTTTNPYVVKIS